MWKFLMMCCLGLALGAPQGPAVSTSDQQTPVPILSQSEDFDEKGGYKFSFETGNGIKVEESQYTKTIPFQRTAENADLKDAPANVEVHVQEGSYSYQGPDGQTYSLKYIADENGFQPIADYLPTAPPLPESLARVLNSNREVEQVSNSRLAPQIAARSPEVDIRNN